MSGRCLSRRHGNGRVLRAFKLAPDIVAPLTGALEMAAPALRELGPSLIRTARIDR